MFKFGSGIWRGKLPTDAFLHGVSAAIPLFQDLVQLLNSWNSSVVKTL